MLADLRDAVRARPIHHQVPKTLQRVGRVRAGLRGRHSGPRQHPAVHVHARDLLRRCPPPPHVDHSQRGHHHHAAELLLEVAQHIPAPLSLEHDLFVLEHVAVHVHTVRSFVRRVDRAARLPQRNQVEGYRNLHFVVLDRYLYARHFVCHIGRVRFG